MIICGSIILILFVVSCILMTKIAYKEMIKEATDE